MCRHRDRYRASYCGMSLLEVLQPFVTFQLLWWDPFATGNHVTTHTVPLRVLT